MFVGSNTTGEGGNKWSEKGMSEVQVDLSRGWDVVSDIGGV